MRFRLAVVTCLAPFAVACATANHSADDDDDDDDIDARARDARDNDDGGGDDIDAPPGAVDAPSQPIDAAIDAPPSCVPGTTQLLINPAFDNTPEGTGWQQTLIDPSYPVITTQTPTGMTPNTLPEHAWMGGFEDGVDTMEQTFFIPAGTTQLVLSGVRRTGTDEIGATVYDTSTIDLTTTSNALVENAAVFSNATTTSTYVPFNKTFASPHAGQTVKLRFVSTQDGSYATSFFYDSLTLNAIVTCP